MGNTTTTNNKKKKSNARKLIPAIGMLMTSAAMLTTSTYAWFTMNKEVSITGITLTASVPETLEISLGSNANGSEPEQANDHTISVTPPSNDDSGSDWSNTVDIAGYYNPNNTSVINFGQLFPVSSVNGANMFYTEDAKDNGRTLKDNAQFTEVNTQLKNSGPNRYYLDIPVWFRSSAVSDLEADVELSVKATIIKTGDENDTSELYKAARVSILNANSAGTAPEISKNGGVILPDGALYNSDLNKAENETKTFLAVNSETTETKKNDQCYGTVDQLIQTGKGNDDNGDETVVKVPKRLKSGGSYDSKNQRHGGMKQMFVRIWLEGEDAACYNPNAGQSFTISLEFKDKAAQTNQSGQSNS